MDEESLRFWIIPMVCVVVVAIIFGASLDYRYNVVYPNAAIEKEMLKTITCPEILEKQKTGRYWSSENALVGAEKALACIPAPAEKSTGGNPYVEFCTPGGFAPVKIIENSTHSFNHDTCIWDLK
ncbi:MULTISPECIES: hypothetical protein [Nitrosopumilus]|uniref:Uncharacterized protein n=1 Tax=Nitrosopumilus piranensis TaxID=1582439 RepID=A0A0C5BXB8_9ARCH|nr:MULTISPECIES: hypothetical protein [Nitrosopumilus]AJM92919.1 hypothetical protein NPIRD3C_1707 [Nitrosopumilus piranensis]